MYFVVPVTEWLNERDGKTRVHALDKTGIHYYLLNTDNISNLRDNGSIPNHPKCSFTYREHLTDRRSVSGYIECNLSVAYIEATALIAYNSRFITIPAYRNNIYGARVLYSTFQVDAIGYAFRYAVDIYNASWIVYNIQAFKTVRVLSPLTLEEIVALVNPSVVTTTTGTTTFVPTTTAFDLDSITCDMTNVECDSTLITVDSI